ncbi:MAG: hypothetical protein Q9187_000962 [Circinaria calcarea]
MLFSVSRHVVLLLLAATSQLVFGDSSSHALGRRAPITPKYSGKWVELKGNRFQGIYKTDHIMGPDNMAAVCVLAARHMVAILKGLAKKPPTAPMAITVYQNTRGDFVFASSGDGEHGEELAARIVPGGFQGGTVVTYSLKDRKVIPACGPGARNCAKRVADAKVRDVQPEVSVVDFNLSEPPTREPSPSSPKDSPSPKGSPNSGSRSSSPRHQRSLDYAAAFVDRRRDLQSFTARDVQAASHSRDSRTRGSRSTRRPVIPASCSPSA